MQQDTLTHTEWRATTEMSEEANTMSSAVAAVKNEQPTSNEVIIRPDTATIDSATLYPLAGNLPLTTKPNIFEQDFWKDGLIHIERAPLVEQLDSATGRTAIYTITTPSGIAGEPIPYRLQDDNVVTIVLFVCFFLVAWVVSESRYFLNHQLKNFFIERTRTNLLTRDPQNELRGRSVLIFQSCFIIGLLLFDLTRESPPNVFYNISPHLTLAVYVGAFLMYFLSKICIYRFVNNVFFTRDQVARWNEIYLLSILSLGLGLFPAALLTTYFSLSSYALSIYILCIIGLVKISLCYKCYNILFKRSYGLIHLLLYFSTLEVAPLLYIVTIAAAFLSSSLIFTLIL